MTDDETIVAVYVRVSTSAQDPQRQLDDLLAYVEGEHPEATVRQYVDVVSGEDTDGGDQYNEMHAAIDAGEIDVVVIHEISRLSRLGGGEVQQFIQHCLRNDTSLKDLETGLSLSVSDSIVDQAVKEMMVSVMGHLARIEQKQKIRRIQSGIRTAQEQGKWLGRPPKGFKVVDGYLRVDPEEFLRIRGALERMAAGDDAQEVAEDTGLPVTTLRDLLRERAELYLRADVDDDRMDRALEDVRPLDEPAALPETWEDRVREIVRDETSQ